MLVAAVCMFGFLEWLTFARIRRSRTTRIADLGSAGFAKIVGVAVSQGEVLRGPFSGDPCVTCQVIACEHAATSTWVGNIPVRDTTRVAAVLFGDAFCVQDASGRALVRLRGNAILLGQERSFHRGSPEVEANLAAFAAGRDPGETAFLAGTEAKRWYYEELIPEGATVAVMGHVRGKPAVEAGDLRVSSPATVIEPDESPVIVSTRKRDSKR